MTRCRPSKWLWGLVPIALIALLVIVGGPRLIEQDLQKRSSLALEKAGLSWALTSFEARDGALRGTAGSRLERDNALNVMHNVWGVRTVEDKARLLARVSPYTWWVSRKGDRIKIKGHVPSKNDRRTILGIIKANLPDLELEDRMKRAAGAPPQQVWLGAISFALKQIGELKHGIARLEDTAFSLSGEARSAAAHKAVVSALKSELPGGVTLKSNSVTPPAVSPFAWSANLDKVSLTLRGAVPSEAARFKITEHAKAQFARTALVDEMQLAAGAPEGWSTAVTLALTQLSRLERGKVALSDVVLTIEGVAKDEGTATDVAKAVRGNLPAIYKSNESIEFQKPEPPTAEEKVDSRTDASPTAPETQPRVATAQPETVSEAAKAIPFTWSARRKTGRVTLTGNIPNEDSRQVLMEAVRYGFPGAAVDDRMVLAGGAPDGWLSAAKLGLAQLQRLKSGQAKLTDRALHLSGIAETPNEAQTIKATLMSSLPATFQASDAITITAAAVDHAVQIARTGPSAEIEKCQSFMDEILKRNTIQFETGLDRLLRDSMPVLDELVGVARRCQRTRIVVSGHTDADGETLNNLDLSRKRAQAVVEFLISKGVTAKRLTAIGYGDTRPVAPNDTQSNKARNRRIEFVVKHIQ
ncbi:MAG: OmpA family protein [Methyloligellaceae bacterium]